MVVALVYSIIVAIISERADRHYDIAAAAAATMARGRFCLLAAHRKSDHMVPLAS